MINQCIDQLYKLYESLKRVKSNRSKILVKQEIYAIHRSIEIVKDIRDKDVSV